MCINYFYLATHPTIFILLRKQHNQVILQAHIQVWSHAILLILENHNSCYTLALAIKFHENPFPNQ